MIPEYCPVFGFKIEIGHSKTYPNTPSLDRIIPDLGYVKSNIWVISHRANKIKNDASIKDLEKLLCALRIKLDSK